MRPLLALAVVAGALSGQTAVYTSTEPANLTPGLNILFFGNSFTISQSNPLVSNPTYGGARGIPELVRRIAIAAGHDAPFVKNVYGLGQGYDFHLINSLDDIDEPKLAGETWDIVVMQGYSVRPTDHPYLGSRRAHRVNALRLFNEVRIGTTRHTLQSPNVQPVLYQTWARHPSHWFYNTSSSAQAGTNIAIGIPNWTRGTIFNNAAEMAAQLRTGYALAQRRINTWVPGANCLIARAGDAWEAINWGVGWKLLYDLDLYHAGSRGDLLSAFMIYGTIYGSNATTAIVNSGALDPVLSAIGVSNTDALEISLVADGVLTAPPLPDEPIPPAPGVLVDLSTAAGGVPGPEELPFPGRFYNAISDPANGAVDYVVDSTGARTPFSIAVTDPFAGETTAGETGAWAGHSGLSGSLYPKSAQSDSFFVGHGFDFTDARGAIEVRGLNPARRYHFTFYGSFDSMTASSTATTTACFTIGSKSTTLDTRYNLNLTSTIRDARPDASGTIEIEVSDGGVQGTFSYLGVFEFREAAWDLYRTAPDPKSGANDTRHVPPFRRRAERRWYAPFIDWWPGRRLANPPPIDGLPPPLRPR